LRALCLEDADDFLLAASKATMLKIILVQRNSMKHANESARAPSVASYDPLPPRASKCAEKLLSVSIEFPAAVCAWTRIAEARPDGKDIVSKIGSYRI